ncbi:helix-turn-helix domain-containing protein [Beggiatoa leptomitoformis]|uniref:Helix-turn-helix domain-containing protein n=1 Tax=Beggiatoa leptomitoformis TaxID=288004 RepID=A0A2N9YH53_9GAMM|nr:helix-turn-helix transcriptional regulator [Beggiatoa leptomitoformis]ALG67904.1 helix-turn-helix domain-containing protein [Beggiatoa leptomitoformis]AUI69830.1 helix-turn-helix domain-containing protein [Beggiatoa leptomitoformis]
MGIGSRIKEIRLSKKLNQKRFSEITNVSRSYISEIESEKSKVSIDVAVGIATHFPDINLNWLLTGDGNILDHNFHRKTPANNQPSETQHVTKKELMDTLELILQETEKGMELVKKMG